MQLIIAEKPSVATDLSRVLPGSFEQHEGYWEGKEHLITWAVGHLLELNAPEDYSPELAAWLLDSLPIIPGEPSGVSGEVLPPFLRKPRAGLSKQLRLIRKLAKRDDVDSIVNACDAAREGELIFREIEEQLDTKAKVWRLWLQSMTDSAILKAFAEMEPAAGYQGLADAAYCRAEADWLIGMNATRGITKRLKGRRESGVWSAGRVQTPTLALLVHRELKVLAHVPVPFWRLKGHFVANGHNYQAQFRTARTGKDSEKIWQEDQALAIQKACLGTAAEVVEKVSESTRNSPALHHLTSLQQEANSRFGLSARRTLAAAQRLYEGQKVLSYPRTSFNGLPEDEEMRRTVEAVIADLASGVGGGGPLDGAFAEAPRADAIPQAAQKVVEDGLKNTARHFDDAKTGDHHAIIPTGTWPSSPLGGDDAKVFELVLRRFLAGFLPPSKWQKVVRETTVLADKAEKPHRFFTESNRMVVPGWQLVDRRPAASEMLGDLGVVAGETAMGTTKEVELEAEETRPPKRYTESSLLKAMESATDLDLDAHEEVEDEEEIASLRECGLGTPATRADTIEALIAKGYVLRSGKTLRAAAKGITLIDFLERCRINHLAKAELTADMEFRLFQVENGRQPPESYMDLVKSGVRDLAEKLRNFSYDDLYRGLEPVGVCPRDGQTVYEGLKGYRCSKEAVGDRFEIAVKGAGKEATLPLADLAALIAKEAAKLEGVIETDAQPKRTNAKVLVRIASARPTPPVIAELEQLVQRVVPAGAMKEFKVGEVDAEVCGFTIWKEFRGRYLNRPVVETLLVEKQSPALDGFVSMRGETYAGQIRLDEDFKLQFEPVKGYKGSDDKGEVAPELVSYAVDASPFVECPRCNKDQIRETPTHFACQDGDGGKGCGLMMPRTVCKRELARKDLQSYFDSDVGHTEWIEDFISRKGRPFTARLVRKPNGRHGFEFKPREGGPAKKKASRKKVAKKTTKRKASKKKATTRKSATRKVADQKGS